MSILIKKNPSKPPQRSHYRFR